MWILYNSHQTDKGLGLELFAHIDTTYCIYKKIHFIE